MSIHLVAIIVAPFKVGAYLLGISLKLLLKPVLMEDREYYEDLGEGKEGSDFRKTHEMESGEYTV